MADVRDEWVELIEKMKVGRSGGKPAVHKPVLVLMLLARAHKAAPREVRFLEIRDELRCLIHQLGTGKGDPKAPFGHLQSDGFWQVQTGDGAPTGAVPKRLWEALTSDPALVEELAKSVLNRFWESSEHASVRSAVGL